MSYRKSTQYNNQRNNNHMKKEKNMANVFAVTSSVAIGVVALTILGGSWYTVDQGERGVILRNGAIIGTAEPGLGFKLPLIDNVARISTRVHSKVYDDLGAYSRDEQPASLRVSVTYRVPAELVEEVYRDYNNVDSVVTRLVDRQLHESVRAVFGQFNAVEAVQQRERLSMDINTAVTRAVKGPITIISIQLENIDFSDAYEASIEQRMLAEIEVRRVQQNAERERVQAEIRVIQANAEADARIAQATAEAEATRLRGDAEAGAIRAKGMALRDNPALIGLIQAERWDGVLPSTMVPNSTVPFLNLGDN
jgi:regulator of protease activity HflC (stomatin/prohibitin superfamily)